MNESAGPEQREDWWSALTGLLLVTICVVAFRTGHGLASQFQWDMHRYAALGVGLAVFFTAAAVGLGLHPLRFAAGFLVLFALALGAFALAAWTPLRRIAVEPAVVALLLGVALGNLFVLPDWLRQAMRAELYIKTGVVLLGASVPLAMVRQAGMVAVVQESAVVFVTFVTIYGIARFLGVERRLGTMLAAGASVCGVPAVLGVAGAVRARREDVSIATMIVVAWALGMVVLQPMLARAWYLSAGTAGAWIGTSESSNAAGLAAVRVYGEYLKSGQLLGRPEQAVYAYTIVKTVGRDLWVAIWVVGLALFSVLGWTPVEGQAPRGTWVRFPIYVAGFALASILVSWATDFGAAAPPGMLGPVEALRDLLFALSLLSIGATVPLQNLAPAGGNAFLAVATGIVANLMVGFILAMFVFGWYWDALSR
jgi:uncharacterized membrane protein YadS